jgi:hypothetical protein
LTVACDAPFPAERLSEDLAEGLQEHSTLEAGGCLSPSAPSAKKRQMARPIAKRRAGMFSWRSY